MKVDLKDKSLEPRFVYITTFEVTDNLMSPRFNLPEVEKIYRSYYHSKTDIYLLRMEDDGPEVMDDSFPTKGITLHGNSGTDDVYTHELIPVTKETFNSIPWTRELIEYTHDNLSFLSKDDLDGKGTAPTDKLPPELHKSVLDAISNIKASEHYMKSNFPEVAEIYNDLEKVMDFILYDSDQDLLPIYRNVLEGGEDEGAYMKSIIQQKLNQFNRADNPPPVRRRALYDIVAATLVQLTKMTI